MSFQGHDAKDGGDDLYRRQVIALEHIAREAALIRAALEQMNQVQSEVDALRHLLSHSRRNLSAAIAAQQEKKL